MNNSVNLTSQRISFVNKIGILQKALSDDETPTPSYLYKEINDISYESIGYSESLVEFIVDRLQHHKSCNVKLKVLKLMKHIAEHGSKEFQLGLRHRVSIIKEHTKFSGPPHPVHGNSPYSMVRNLAVELCERLYNMNTLALNTSSKEKEEGMHSQQQQKYSGMGPSSRSGGAIQGFGNSPPASHSKGIAGTILQEIEKLGTRLSVETPADRQAAVLARLNLSASSSNYQPPVVTPGTPDALTPLSPKEQLVESVQQPPSSMKQSTHHPGKAGGGWNDDDDDDDEEDANNDNGGVIGGNADDACHRVDAVIGSGEWIGINDKEKDEIQTWHNNDTSESKEGENVLVVDSEEKRLVDECLSGAPQSSSASCSAQSPGYLSNSDIGQFIQTCSKLRCGLVLDCICHRLGEKDAKVAAKSLQLLEAFVYSRTQLVSVDRLAARCKPVLVDCFNNAATQAVASQQGGDNNDHDDDEMTIDRNSRNKWITVQTKTAKLILILQQLSSHKDILPSSYISQELAIMVS